MIDGKKLIKGELECYNCGCNLKPVCADYERAFTELRVQLLHENAKMPERAHPTDAGMDLFFCPPPNPDLPKQMCILSTPVAPGVPFELPLRPFEVE